MSEVLFEVNDGVATISLNRPDKLNAVTPAMARMIGERFRAADADRQVHAIVLTGRGRGFCAGADLAVLAEGPSALASFVRDPSTFPIDALTISKPVVAAVAGPVAGIGMALLAAADVRFAGTDARFTTSFARLGLVAEYGLSWLLPRVVGASAAADLLLSGRTIDSQEALRIGLVAEVVEPKDVLARASEYARDLAERCSPRSLAVIKQQLRRDATSDYRSAFERSIDLMVDSFDAADLAEAMEAAKAGRPPQFPPPEVLS